MGPPVRTKRKWEKIGLIVNEQAQEAREAQRCKTKQNIIKMPFCQDIGLKNPFVLAKKSVIDRWTLSPYHHQSKQKT